MENFIIIDKKVANSFIHEMNHLRLQWVPKEIQELEFNLTIGGRMTIGKLFEDAQERIKKLTGYMELAMKENK